MSATQDILADARAEVDGMREIGVDFHRRGWSLGTSSNYSIVAARSSIYW